MDGLSGCDAGEGELSSTTRMLFVSHAFPPQAAVGALRIARLCRFLPEYGIQPVVLTAEERFYESLDHSVPAPGQTRVVRSPVLATPLDWYRRIKQLGKSGGGNPDLAQRPARTPGVLYRHVLALLQTPDRYWGWYWPALRAADQLLREEKIDVMFSSGPPWISHLVARRIKQKYRLSWFADFRDPWVLFPREPHSPAWQQRLAERLEQRCVREADLLICNTDRLRQAFERRYGGPEQLKFRTLTNGFIDLDRPAITKSKRRVFLHLGSIYGGRRIDTFLQAIAMLTKSGRLDPKSFQLVFQGDLSPGFVASSDLSVAHLVETGCLEFRPRVSWEKAQDVLWSSDLLLLFQGDHQLQVPAKFYECLQTGIPMFAVAQEGALTDLLSSTHSGLWASPDDAANIAERFLEVLRLSPRSPEYVQHNLSAKYHYRALAGQLAEWVEAAPGLQNNVRGLVSSTGV
jgi:glycosyltransferase involved in cell wall biosynthesis